jgi:hypothetical protein
LLAVEAPSVVTEMRAPTTPPPPAPATTAEEGEVATEATVTQAALEAPSEAGPSVEGVVVVLDEDSTPPPPSECHDAAMAPALESAQVPATASLLPAVEVPVPSPAGHVQGPLPTAEVVESSLARVSLMVEKMMDLETCQYIDFPGVGVIDLEAPQLPEKEYEVTAERRSNESMIMETIVSVSKALQEYKRAGGFAKAAVTDAGNTVLAAPATNMEPSADASVPPRVDECREASPSQLVEATETPAPVAKPVSAEAVVGEEGTSSPDLVAAEAEGAETRVPGEPAAVAQESAVPEMVARATTPEIQVAEETGVSHSQGAAGGEAQTLELVCTLWSATSGLDANSEDNEKAAARHTLERGMTWARRAFDELIPPATSVSFLVKDFFDSAIFSSYVSYSSSIRCRPSSLPIGDAPARFTNSARSGPSWRCSLSWPGYGSRCCGE